MEEASLAVSVHKNKNKNQNKESIEMEAKEARRNDEIAHSLEHCETLAVISPFAHAAGGHAGGQAGVQGRNWAETKRLVCGGSSYTHRDFISRYNITIRMYNSTVVVIIHHYYHRAASSN